MFGVGFGVNMLIDNVNSDVDIGLRRPSEVIVAVGDTGNTAVELGTNKDVKIGMKIELTSGGNELGVKALMERDNSDVGKGIRIFVVRTGVGTIVVITSPISEETLKSIIGDVVKGSDLSMSEELIENKNVSVGEISIELSSDNEIADGDNTSIVEAMLKDNLDVEGVGVITIITAVLSSIGNRSIMLLLVLIPREERSGFTRPGLLLALINGLELCTELLLTRMKGRSIRLLLIVRKGT